VQFGPASIIEPPPQDVDSSSDLRSLGSIAPDTHILRVRNLTSVNPITSVLKFPHDKVNDIVNFDVCSAASEGLRCHRADGVKAGSPSKPRLPSNSESPSNGMRSNHLPRPDDIRAERRNHVDQFLGHLASAET
jgi:hypothetical protein